MTYDDMFGHLFAMFWFARETQENRPEKRSGKMLFQCLDQAGEGELQPHEVYFLDKWLLDDTHLRILACGLVHGYKGFCTRTLFIVA